MYGVFNISDNDIKYVVNHLCEKSKEELLLGCGSDYKEIVFREIRKTPDKYLIKTKKNNKPAGLVGVIKIDDNSAGLFFVTTDDLQSGNMITLLRQSRSYIKVWNEKYKLILDNCYRKNTVVMKWLKFLGFKQLSVKGDFILYYKGEINEYSK